MNIISAQIAKIFVSAMAGLFFLAAAAEAKVPQGQANRLGRDLTPMGSEKAGNAGGSIPAWTGGLSSIPPNVKWISGQGQHADPFTKDKPLFTIKPSNMKRYGRQLTEGYKALLDNYSSSFTMPVYKTRRTCSLPAFVYKSNKRNALVGKLVGGGNGVSEAIMGTPFPIPELRVGDHLEPHAPLSLLQGDPRVHRHRPHPRRLFHADHRAGRGDPPMVRPRRQARRGFGQHLHLLHRQHDRAGEARGQRHPRP